MKILCHFFNMIDITIDQIKLFISRTPIFPPDIKIFKIDFKEDASQLDLQNEFICFISMKKEQSFLTIYDNFAFYVIINFHNQLKKLFHKIKKVFTFSDEVNYFYSKFKDDFNEEFELVKLDSQGLREIFSNYYKNPLYSSIMDSFLCSLIYKNTLSRREYITSIFHMYDNAYIKKQTINIKCIPFQPFFTQTTFLQKKSQNFFNVKYYNNNNYYSNEINFIEKLNKYRKLKNQFNDKVLLDKKTLDKNSFCYNNDSYFPIVNSYVSSKDSTIICEYISQESLRDRYFYRKSKRNLIDFLIAIINIVRSINLIHSFGFIYRDINPNNYLFTDSNSKLPILYNISAVMSMKMMTDHDEEFYANEYETSDLGSTQFFAPEKINSDRFSFPCDIFSFGLLFYSVFVGEDPFPNLSLFSIFDRIKNNELPSFDIKKNNNDNKNEENISKVNEISNLYDIQREELSEINTLYQSCVLTNPRDRLTIREIGFSLLKLSEKIKERIQAQSNSDINNLNILNNCEFGLIDELSSPIPFVQGLSDSYYLITNNNELNDFNFFLIDHESIYTRAIHYISQINFGYFGFFHFDKFQNKDLSHFIKNITLCFNKYAIIVRNTGNLINNFLKFLSDKKLGQAKLIPSCTEDYNILQKYQIIKDENVINWEKVKDLSEIAKKILQNIERNDNNLRESKSYSLIPLISYLVAEKYYIPNKIDQIQTCFELNNKDNFFFDLDSFSLLIKDDNINNMIINNMNQITNDNLQEFIINKSIYYHYYPFENRNNEYKLSKMTEKSKSELLYQISSILIELQHNKLYLNSLTFSDLYLFEGKNKSNKSTNFDFKLKTYNNLSLISDPEDYNKNISNFLFFAISLGLSKIESEKISGCINKNRISFQFINNYLYSKSISQSNKYTQFYLTHLAKLSFNDLPFKFNGNDILPKDFLGTFSDNIFNFDFYNIISDDDFDNIKDQVQKAQPFLTFEFISDDKLVICIENKVFLLNNSDKFNDLLDLDKNPNLVLIPIKEDDKKFIPQNYKSNFFEKLEQINIQLLLEDLKKKIMSYLLKKHQSSSYQNYILYIQEFLIDFFEILNPVIAYTIFKFYFPASQFTNKDLLNRPFEKEKNLIDFAPEAENLILISNIGQGSTSTIHLVVHFPTLYPLVVKNYSLDMEKYFYIEKKIGEEIKSQKIANLASFYGYIDKSNQKSLIMRFYPNGSIEDICKKKLEESEISTMYKAIYNGITNLHKIHYIHRDIKPDNILFDNNNEPVIIDFNGAISAEEKDKCEHHISEVGSYQFSSPQLLNGEYYDYKTDNYSLSKIFNIYFPFFTHTITKSYNFSLNFRFCFVILIYFLIYLMILFI
ncbi:hypothetical protein M9Y10_025873 [Tritrichomonas musculus]|uniref:Protein kinase domain-containing protein n=1 Tax=Tritrichomonas musculus TaxID=1915356 RepID=A0ABR2H8P2_9EUKA